ncbi:MAG: hypothetical protein ABIQ39_05065 [Ilumatobacteraceae bacterium]
MLAGTGFHYNRQGDSVERHIAGGGCPPNRDDRDVDRPGGGNWSQMELGHQFAPFAP